MKRIIITFAAVLCLALPATGSIPDRPTNFLSITLSATTIQTGQTLTVFFASGGPVKKIELELLGQKLPMYHIWHKEFKHVFRTFAGVPVKTRPGKYRVVVHAQSRDGNPLSLYAWLTVRKARFKIQRIHLSKRKTKLLDHEQLRREGRRLAVQFRKQDRKVYFAAPFRIPAPGRISSEFGLRRQYNGNAISSHHKGLDIANKTGTPVRAANAGRVEIAARWKSHGKTVVINHGHGIATVYIHMDRILVKKGEWVKQGHLIGRIGSSGIATGPHLHFGISVNNVRVDPEQWVQNKVRLYF